MFLLNLHRYQSAFPRLIAWISSDIYAGGASDI